MGYVDIACINSIPLVTVVIPAYNAAEFIGKTLASIQSQTYTFIEIIVVNDGSTDDTVQIVTRIMQNDPRVRVLSKSNGGVASARNAGLSAAHGEYVSFVDADDLCHPKKLEFQVAALQENPDCSSSFVLYTNIDRNDKITSYNVTHDTRRRFYLPSHLVLRPVGNGSSLLVRRAAAIEVGGYDPTYASAGAGGAEDLDFELKLVSRTPMLMVPQYLLGYRFYQGNMSSDRPRMARSTLLVLERCIQRNPDLNRRVVLLARRSAARYAIASCLHAGAVLHARKLFVRHLLFDPAGAVLMVASMFSMRLARKVTGLLKILRPDTVESHTVYFSDMKRTLGGLGRTTQDEALLSWLSGEDERWLSKRPAMEARSVGSR